jgi:hypothetical protein
MTVDELVKQLNGTYGANKVRAQLDGKTIVAAVFVGDELTLTDDGRRALNRSSADDVVVKEDAPKAPKTKKAKAGLETTAEPAAELELPDVQLSDE